VANLELVSQSEPAHKALVTTLGAGLRSLQVAGRTIIPDYPTNEAPAYAGVVMFPWAGRLPDGLWRDGEETRSLPINDEETPAALHGLVCDEDFEVLEQTASSVVLGHTLSPHWGYPYSLRLEVSYSMEAHGLVVSDRVVNVGTEVAPFALAHHPYFALGGATLHEVTVSAPVVGTMARTENKIPVAQQSFDPANLPLSVLDVDDTYLLEFQDTDRVAYRLHTPDGVLELWQGPEWPWLHIYSTPWFPSVHGNIPVVALEPHTAVPNSLNWQDQLIYLSPGAVWEGEWGIRFHQQGARSE
jgi:aldose 1-epimerase